MLCAVVLPGFVGSWCSRLLMDHFSCLSPWTHHSCVSNMLLWAGQKTFQYIIVVMYRHVNINNVENVSFQAVHKKGVFLFLCTAGVDHGSDVVVK
jgi:hypothetical protein